MDSILNLLDISPQGAWNIFIGFLLVVILVRGNLIWQFLMGIVGIRTTISGMYLGTNQTKINKETKALVIFVKDCFNDDKKSIIVSKELLEEIIEEKGNKEVRVSIYCKNSTGEILEGIRIKKIKQIKKE